MGKDGKITKEMEKMRNYTLENQQGTQSHGGGWKMIFLFPLGDFLGLQPIIFQGVVIFDSDKKNMRCKIMRVDKAILTNVPY